MSPKLRIEYPGAMYHVMNRGDQREDIFRDDEDRQRFLSTLGEACGKTEWQVHAYCLMRNCGRTTERSAHRAKHFGLPGLLGASLPLGRKSGFGYSGCSQRAGPAFQPGLLTKSRMPLRHGYGVRRQGPPRRRFG